MLEAVEVVCPYCGEPISALADCSAGSRHYIEDCPVCCRPVEFFLETGFDQELVSLTARREDD